MNISLKVFDGLDHDYTPEKILPPNDGTFRFNRAEQPLDPVAHNQRRNELEWIHCSSSATGLAWFLHLGEWYGNDNFFDSVSAFTKQFSSQNAAY